MIELIIGFLVAKWWTNKEEKKKQVQEFAGNIECAIPFGYVRDGETIQDLK